MSCITGVLIHKLPACVIPILSVGGALHAATPHPLVLIRECTRAAVAALHEALYPASQPEPKPSNDVRSKGWQGGRAIFFLSNAQESCVSFH